jgi:peroxiredoxin Q/BCP
MGLRDLMNKVPTPLKQAVKERVYPQLLPEGELAPEWHLQSYDDSWHRMRGTQWSILVFYPGDDTPGCTQQLTKLAEHYPTLQELGVQVYGVNPAEASSHKAFAEKLNLPFPLLIDRGAGVCRQFAATLPIPYGIKTIRTVYLVNPERKIRLANRGAPPVEAIIRSIQALQATKGGM